MNLRGVSMHEQLLNTYTYAVWDGNKSHILSKFTDEIESFVYIFQCP